jgi:ketosteroid isomerase-like protein
MKQLLFALVLFLVIAPAAWAQNADEKALLKLENDWDTAWVKRDAKFLEQLYASEFYGIVSSGKTYNRAEYLKADLSTADVDRSFTLSDLRVHIYGQVGVVHGRNLVRYKEDGKVSEHDVLFTDVYVKRDGRWQCVSTQSTLAPKK